MRFRKFEILVTKSEIDRQSGRYAKIVLHKEVIVGCRQLQTSQTKTLQVLARVALADCSRGGSALCRSRQSLGEVNIIDNKIIDVVVRVGTGTAKEVLDIVGHEIDIAAELDGVTTA